MATTIADLETQVKALQADIADLKSPLVGYVLNNWETRPALILASTPDGYDVVVFTKGESDGAENASGYSIRTGVKKNNAKHIPGTWHDKEG